MNTRTKDETQGVCREILSYLESHPDAADNLDGVVNWWLLQQRYLAGLNQVESALNLLILRQAVEKIENPDGTIIYRASRGNQGSVNN